ncbi:unnamed protein product [Linum trigynum]|uniref:Uncharacterized protein n=1 Tax=Linum trigynum TaxID=586398 RepID=A0AAV2EU48_9ROSI
MTETASRLWSPSFQPPSTGESLDTTDLNRGKNSRGPPSSFSRQQQRPGCRDLGGGRLQEKELRLRIELGGFCYWRRRRLP